MTSKIDALKQTYIADAQKASSKSRFGYFSIPPPLSAGDTQFQQKQSNICINLVVKNQMGKVKTQERNIFSGPSATGSLKKNFFSYLPTAVRDCPYYDPGKVQRVKNKQQSQKYQDHEVFKPASLYKSMINASYEYIPQKNNGKTKNRRDADGKVIIEQPNVKTSPLSKIQYLKNKKIEYKPDPYDNPKLLRKLAMEEDLKKRGQGPFKAGNPVKEYFSSYKQQFGNDNNIPHKQSKISKSTTHIQEPFKPVCKATNSTFSRPQYMPEGKKPVIKSEINSAKQCFKLTKIQKNSKPCPSISCSYMNLMKCFR